jgi:hypothetical protein
MGTRPRGLSTTSATKETAQMRKFAPYAVTVAMLVAALFQGDLTYWP